MFLNFLFVAKKQKYKEHTAACNPCLKRSVNKTKKQRAAGGCAGPVQYSATTGEWKEKQRVISSVRTANVHCSSESTEMHTAETEFKKKKKTAHCFKGKTNQLLGGKMLLFSFVPAEQRRRPRRNV